MKQNNNTIEIKGVEYIPVSEANKIQVEPVEGTPVGQYCIVRCRDAGVWAGIVKEKQGRDATLVDARRLWWWKAAKGHTLSAVANYGLSESKAPAPVPVVFLTETSEFIPCSKDAEKSIREQEAHNE